MRNIKGIAVATDGNLKRIAITYDEIDATTGKVISQNVKTNRVVTDDTVLEKISKIEAYAQSVIDSE